MDQRSGSATQRRLFAPKDITVKVMIVEDNARMRKMIKSFIADVADEITECDDGEDALELYRQSQPDAVLMDIEMKGTDGLKATSNIKSAFPDARILVVSQWDLPALRKRAQSAGAEAFVSKSDLQPLKDLLLKKEPASGSQ
jgi:two-component system, NarL family, response regulator DesR